MNDATPIVAPAETSTIAVVLNRIAEDVTAERISVADVVGSLGSRAHGFLLLLLAAGNLTPGPSLPGFSTILAVPMILVALQMVFGVRNLWLPQIIMRRTMPRGFFVRLINALVRMLVRLDRVLKPRLDVLTSALAERLLGLVALLLSALLLVPLPFYPLLPAFGAIVLALGLLTRDGIAVASALVLTAASVVSLLLIIQFFGYLLGLD